MCQWVNLALPRPELGQAVLALARWLAVGARPSAGSRIARAQSRLSHCTSEPRPGRSPQVPRAAMPVGGGCMDLCTCCPGTLALALGGAGLGHLLGFV